jgi:hypothetical protein
MNDQLRTLVRQAVVAVDIVTGNEALDDELAKMYIPDCFAEKFAELIVRECMRMCEVTEMSFVTHDCDIEASGAITVKQFIAEHFGVED